MIHEIKYRFGAQRYLLGLLIGVVITCFFYWLMQFLIYVAERELDESKATRIVDFTRSKRNEDVRTEDEVEKPPQVEALPQTETSDDWDEGQLALAVPVNAPKIETNINPGSGGREGEYLPIIKVAPRYPTTARDRGIEGFCTVEYTVTSDGTVRDVRVIEGQCTSRLFYNPSLRAAKKFRYKPRVINGVTVEVPGVRNQFTYKLDE